MPAAIWSLRSAVSFYYRCRCFSVSSKVNQSEAMRFSCASLPPFLLQTRRLNVNFCFLFRKWRQFYWTSDFQNETIQSHNTHLCFAPLWNLRTKWTDARETRPTFGLKEILCIRNFYPSPKIMANQRRTPQIKHIRFCEFAVREKRVSRLCTNNEWIERDHFISSPLNFTAVRTMASHGHNGRWPNW